MTEPLTKPKPLSPEDEAMIRESLDLTKPLDFIMARILATLDAARAAPLDVERLRVAMEVTGTPIDAGDWDGLVIDIAAEYARLSSAEPPAASLDVERLRETAQAVLDELDIIRRPSSDPTYPRLMVHIDTHAALRAALISAEPPTTTSAARSAALPVPDGRIRGGDDGIRTHE